MFDACRKRQGGKDLLNVFEPWSATVCSLPDRHRHLSEPKIESPLKAIDRKPTHENNTPSKSGSIQAGKPGSAIEKTARKQNRVVSALCIAAWWRTERTKYFCLPEADLLSQPGAGVIEFPGPGDHQQQSARWAGNFEHCDFNAVFASQ
jgi:hypothetical protein